MLFDLLYPCFKNPDFFRLLTLVFTVTDGCTCSMDLDSLPLDSLIVPAVDVVDARVTLECTKWGALKYITKINELLITYHRDIHE